MMKKIKNFSLVDDCFAKARRKEKTLLLRCETRAEARSANKIVDKAQTNPGGIAGRRGIAEF